MKSQVAIGLLSLLGAACITWPAHAQVLLPVPPAVDGNWAFDDRDGCATVLTPERAAEQEFLDAWLDAQEPDFEPRRTFHIRINLAVVHRDDGTGGLPAADVQKAFDDLNEDYRTWGIEFVENGARRDINSSTFFDIDNEGEFINLCVQNLILHTINVYFVNSITGWNGPAGGEATFPSYGHQGIIVKFSAATNGSTLTHEVGHYFNLYHTHETDFGPDCPDDPNDLIPPSTDCHLNGDKVCDTAPDPGLQDISYDSQCNASGLPNSSLPTCVVPGIPYSPDTRNYMSYAPSRCRDRLTEGQIYRLYICLRNSWNRADHIINENPFGDVWIHYGADSPGDGNFETPYSSLWDANQNTGPGATFIIWAGTSGSIPQIRISNPHRIDSFRGTATVGR